MELEHVVRYHVKSFAGRKNEIFGFRNIDKTYSLFSVSLFINVDKRVHDRIKHIRLL